jgi:hypothetical protein
MMTEKKENSYQLLKKHIKETKYEPIEIIDKSINELIN